MAEAADHHSILTRPGASAAQPAFVTELLPPTVAPPASARRISFVLALMGYWILPRRLGPHLAAGSWVRALAAHYLALMLCAALWGGYLIYRDYYAPNSQRQQSWITRNRPAPQFKLPRSLYEWRVRCAELVLDTIPDTATTGGAAVNYGILALPLLTPLPFLLIGTLLMPWAAGGDRASSVWRRSARNSLWATLGFVPGTALLVFMSWFASVQQMLSADWEWRVNIACFGLAMLWLYLQMRAWFRGAWRYVGPPDGPAFAPRPPICDDCSYTLTGLATDARCPECGLEVALSLPGGRRQPTGWQIHALSRRGIREHARLTWRILRKPATMRSIPVHSGQEAARHFAGATILWIGTAGGSVLTIAATIANAEFFYLPTTLALGCLLIAPLLLLLHLLATAILCIAAQRLWGVQDYRTTATACMYASANLWPLAVALLLAIPLSASQTVSSLPNSLWVGSGGLFIDRSSVLHALIWLPALVGLVFWIGRMGRAAAAVRFANV